MAVEGVVVELYPFTTVVSAGSNSSVNAAYAPIEHVTKMAVIKLINFFVMVFSYSFTCYLYIRYN